MDNKCYAKFMADVVPLVEALLKCEEDAKAPHTSSGQRIHPVAEALQDFEAEHKKLADAAQECALNLKHTEHLTMACPTCGENLIGRWNRVLASLTAYCKKCNRIKYKANTEDESWEPVDYPWYETEKKKK